MQLNLGKRIAPPRFLFFGGVFLVAFLLAAPRFGSSQAAMGAFDAAAALTLLAWTTLLGQGTAHEMRRAAAENDANRGTLLVLVGVITLAVLFAVYRELQGHNSGLQFALVIATLALAWLFANTVYALHYAHVYYQDTDGSGDDDRGLGFSHCSEPDYWDFLYFSYTLGMTFQTSDTAVASRRLRRIVTGHALLAFVFNIGVIAFTVNSLGSSGG